MIQVGAERHPTHKSGKLLMLAWSTFSLIVIATYTANLAAFFTNPESDKPLCSVFDIERSSFNASTFIEFKEILKGLRNPLVRNLMKSDRISFDMSLSENIDGQIVTTLESKKVFIAHESLIESAKKVQPRLYTLDGYFTYATEGFALKKDHRLVRNITSLFMSYEAEGFFQQVKRKYVSQGGCRWQSKEKIPVKTIQVGNFREVIMILGNLALISLVLELTLYFYSNRVSNCSIQTGKH